MSKKKKLVKKKEKIVKSINNNIRSSVRKLNPILKGIVGKKVELAIRDLQFSEKRITKDIRKIITLGKKASECMIISPSIDFGTNALFLSLPTRMNLKFGPNSFFEHQKEATKQSIKTIIAPLDSLKDDLDTGKDLKLLKTKKPSLFKKI